MHQLFIGVTLSGKTTLAREFSRKLLEHKKLVAVYDPLGTATAGGDWGEGALIFSDREKFLDFVHSDACVNYHIFVDEAHHVFHHTMGENFWMLTEGRHHGMYFYLISQRPKKIHPDVRTGCAVCYMFRLAQDDAKEIGADYGHSNIHKENLDKGDFLVLNSGSAEFSRANVFTLLEKDSP